MFGQLQLALNRIWEVQPKPAGGGLASIWMWLRKRLLSMGMVLVLAFLLIASLVVSAVVAYIVPADLAGANLATAAVSLVIFVPLFALMFKFLPDAEVQWRDVIFGGGDHLDPVPDRQKPDRLVPGHLGSRLGLRRRGVC